MSSSPPHRPGTARKKTSSPPEIKMTRAQELRQKPMQSSSRLKVKAGLPVDKGLIVRNSLSSLGSQESLRRARNSASNSSINSVGMESFTSSGETSYKAPQSPKAEPGKSVIDRLYKAPANAKHDFLRKSDRALPERYYQGKIPGEENFAGTESYKVYDWVNRKVRSQDDIRDEKTCSSATVLTHATQRRNSEPIGADNFVHGYSSEMENGFNIYGPRFFQEYFQKELRWLAPRVDMFLTRRNLGPKLPAATNEESYIWEERKAIVVAPRLEDREELFVDMIDMLCGEVTWDKFSEFVHEKEPQEIPKPFVHEEEVPKPFVHEEEVPKPFVHEVREPEEVPKPFVEHVSVQTEKVKCDAWTITLKPFMVNKLVGAEPKHNMSTSTDDLRKYVKPRITVGTTTADLQELTKPRGIPVIRVEVGTSTGDLHDDWSDSSLTPRASPVSVVQDDVSPSTYNSLHSENLKRSLIDRVNSYYREINVTNLHSNKWADRRRSSKAVMTDDETTQIHSELNKLASERIEIIELLALHIPNLPSCLTVELLEAKLNYSIGQTDQLLALLEDSWELEASLPSSSRSKEMINITREIIFQSRAELEESKKAIKLCLDEVRHIQAGGHSRKRFLNREIMKMKRRAEIEAFKLERMWEQLFYERSKKQEQFLRSTYPRSPSVSSTDSAVDAMEKYVHFLTDLRKRSALAASEDELNDLRMRSHLSHYDYGEHHDSSWDTSSIFSTSSQASHASPRHHKDYLVELRRQMALERERDFPYSRSRSISPCRCSFSSTHSRLSSPSQVDSGLGQSGASSALQPQYSSSSWSKRHTGPGSLYTASSKSTAYRSSSQQPSSLYMSQVDLLSPTRPSYRSAGRYSVK
ncbi:uncharacterized protein LOC124132326 [Haliotis rufescens]|uniref:uncharacterized protein LOC124132326 n=1 Tax=Haliotis rufescens TaxID=6454 RepID=UPI00201EAA39|nr:uncharacterized protein LOC124132326 [Haliotis rufescens]